MSKGNFEPTYGPLADDISARTGLHRSVVLGLIAQETGHGDHIAGNNITGISPGGQVAGYKDVPEAGQAFVDLINRRYSAATKLTDPHEQALALQRLGYNPDPMYGHKVSALARTFRNDPAQAASAPTDDDLYRELTGGSKASTASPSAPQSAPAGATAPAGPAAPASDVSDAQLYKELTSGNDPVVTKKNPGPQAENLGIPSPDDGNGPGYKPEKPSLNERVSKGMIDATKAVGNKLYEAAVNPSSLLSDAGKKAVAENAPFVSNYVMPVVDRVTSLPGAVFGAAQAGVATMGDAVSPGLGRDLAAGMEVAPLLGEGAVTKLGHQAEKTRVTEGVAKAADVAAEEANAGRRINPETPSPLSPEHRHAEELARAHAPPAVGSSEVFVEGSTPNKAEVTGRPRDAVALARNRELVPGKHVEADQARGEARAAAFDDVAGSAADVTKAEAERIRRQDPTSTFEEVSHERARAQNENRTDGQPIGRMVRSSELTLGDHLDMKAEAKVNLKPVLETVRAAVDDPVASRSMDVTTTLDNLLQRLEKDGSRIETPAEVYGARAHLQAALDKGLDPVADKHMRKILGQIDEALAKSVPRYGEWLKDQASRSDSVAVNRNLQAARADLVDGHGRIKPAEYDRWMKQIVDERAPGATGWAANITPEQMAQLENIHADVKRQLSLAHLGDSAPPSLIGKLGGNLLSDAGNLILHGTAFTAAGPWGAAASVGARHVAYPVGKAALERATAAQKARNLLRSE